MITVFRSVFAQPRHLILVLAALWLGLALAEKHLDRRYISKDALNNIVYYGILGYVIGGRLLFVLAHLSAFAASPLGIFSLNVDLFDSTAGLVTVMIAGFICGVRQRPPLWSTLDALTPLFATLAVGLPLSHLAAGTAFGHPTSLPWGIDLWNANRHPTQIYDFITSLGILGLLWFRKIHSPAGSEFISFTALTACARLFLEAFRGDSTLVFGGLRLAQILAWIVLAAAFVTKELLLRKENTG